MSACNPYKVLSNNKQHDDDLECKFEEKNVKDLRLSHRVNPLKPNLLHNVWDFEALSEDSERMYILKILKGDNPRQMKLLSKIICCVHNLVKNEIEKNQSSVSLRDIVRVHKIFHFCVVFFKYVEEGKTSDFDQELEKYQNERQSISDSIFFKAMVITVSINYYFRLYKLGKYLFIF